MGPLNRLLKSELWNKHWHPTVNWKQSHFNKQTNIYKNKCD